MGVQRALFGAVLFAVSCVGGDSNEREQQAVVCTSNGSGSGACDAGYGGDAYGGYDGGGGEPQADAAPIDAAPDSMDAAIDAPIDSMIDAGIDSMFDAPPDSMIDAPPDAAVCTMGPPPLPTLPNFNRRFELKGDTYVPGSEAVAEIKLGAEIRSSGMSGGPGMECEAQSSAALLGYLFVKILGQEAGASISGNGGQHICKTKECTNPPNFSCGGQQCETGTVGGAVAVYRGVEWKLCDKLKKLGWVGAQFCKYVDVKAGARIGIGATATIAVTEGKPTGSCTSCCENGRTLGSLEAGPSGLLEGKAAVSFKLWKLQIEAGIGAKGCASLTGKIGNKCDGSPYLDPEFHYYGAICVESMVAPGLDFRIINNNARICVPLGFWEYCFDVPRCWKTNTDAAKACPSGTPNPE